MISLAIGQGIEIMISHWISNDAGRSPEKLEVTSFLLTEM